MEPRPAIVDEVDYEKAELSEVSWLRAFDLYFLADLTPRLLHLSSARTMKKMRIGPTMTTTRTDLRRSVGLSNGHAVVQDPGFGLGVVVVVYRSSRYLPVVYTLRYIRYERRIMWVSAHMGHLSRVTWECRAPFLPSTIEPSSSMVLTTVLTALSLLATTASALDSHLVHFGGQGINLLKIREQQQRHEQERSTSTGLLLQQQSTSDNYSPLLLEEKYPAHYFEQALDHFDASVNQTFRQRYWVDDRFYRAGGPVIVLDGGETSGTDRLSFLDHGILAM